MDQFGDNVTTPVAGVMAMDAILSARELLPANIAQAAIAHDVDSICVFI